MLVYACTARMCAYRVKGPRLRINVHIYARQILVNISVCTSTCNNNAQISVVGLD